MEVDINRPFQYENDEDVGVSVIDSYTHFVLEYLEGINKTSTTSMKDLVRFRPGLYFPCGFLAHLACVVR